MSRIVIVSACTLASLIALTSCFPGQTTRSAATAGAASQQPTRSPGSTSPASQGPFTVQISPQYTEVFATPVPAGPGQAAVISGFRQSQILWDQSTVALHLVGMTTEYVTGSALTSLNTVLASYRKNNLVPVGADRLFDTKITSLTAVGATVTSCDDGSRYNVADRSNGQTESPVPVSQQYDFAVFAMSRVDGRWAVSSVTVISYPDQRVKACMQDAGAL